MNLSIAMRQCLPTALCWFGLGLLASPIALPAQIARQPGGSQPGGSQSGGSQPGGPQAPGLSSSSNHPTLTNPDPRPDGATLKYMRVRAYQRMRQDSSALQELSTELDRRVNGSGDVSNAVSDEVKAARKIQKLAAEIDRLMRED